MEKKKKNLNEFILGIKPHTIVIDYISFPNDIRQPTFSDMIDSELNSFAGTKLTRPDNMCYLITISGSFIKNPWAHFSGLSCFDLTRNVIIVEDMVEVIGRYENNSYLMHQEKSFYTYQEKHKDRISVFTNLKAAEDVIDTVILEIHKIYNPYEL